MTDDSDLTFSSLFFPLNTIKVICFLTLIGFIVYFNSLFNGFVGDDRPQIVDNPKIQSLQNFANFYLEDRLEHKDGNSALGATYYKPMLDTYFALIYSLFGPSQFAFHFFQLVLIIINANLVFILFKKFFNLEVAFILALIFLVHPINSEAAIYISATQEVLFTLFGLSGLLLIDKLKGYKSLFLVASSLLLAVFSKETGVLYLLIGGLYKSWRERKILLSGGMVLIAFAVYLILRIHATGFFNESLVNAPIQRLTFFERALNMPLIFLFYLKIFLFPLNLSSSYQWIVKSPELFNFYFPILIEVVLGGLLIWFGIFLYKEKKKYVESFLFFSIWFLLGLGFHSQFLALDQTVAERWFYFPVIGMLGVIGVMWEVGGIRVTKNKTITIILFGIILLMLGGRTFLRTFDYRDDFTLASKDIWVSPESYNLEYIISHIYYQQGKLDEAKVHGLRSVELFPYITNLTNLGAIYSRQGDYANAKKSYLEALKYGDDQLPYDNLVSLSLVYGDRKENIEFIKNVALERNPRNGRYWLQLGMLEYMEKNVDQATLAFNEASKYSKDPMIDFMKKLIAEKRSFEVKAENGEMKFVIDDKF